MSSDSDFTPPELTPEEVARRKARQVEVPKPVSLAMGVALRLAEQIRIDDTLSESEKMAAFRSLPRNRRDARRLLKGNGPWMTRRRD